MKKRYDFLLFCGDIHGNIDVIPKFLKKNELSNCAICQCGDFGIGWENPHKNNRVMNYLNDRLINCNSDLFVIRGNHDDPKFFNEEYSLSNLFLLKDYSVININDINILGLGGAISIDRTDRKAYWGKSSIGYWKDENFNLNINKLKELRNIDIVFSHSAPNFCFPIRKNGVEKYIIRDKELEIDLNNERDDLNTAYEIIKENNNIKNWYYGHFHKSNVEYTQNTIFTLLDINELKEYRI